MFAMFSRILKLSGRYKGRIQGAFVCAFLESILSKMPIVLAFVVLSRFAADTLTSQTCLYIGLGLAAAVLVQMLVHYLSDSLQSAAGYLMFADKRMELGSHLRKLPMGYFTSGNIGKISSVLSTDMVFIEEVAMSTLGNMMGYLLSSLILLVFMFDRLGRKDDETPFVVEWFVKNGIEVWSAMEGQQRFDNHVDKLLNYIRYWQASGESIKTSVRVKTRISQLTEEGYYTGGIVPYGYRLENRGRTNKRNKEVCDLAIDLDEAEVVKVIFQKYVYEGYGSQRISRYLAEQGFRNRKGAIFPPPALTALSKIPSISVSSATVRVGQKMY